MVNSVRSAALYPVFGMGMKIGGAEGIGVRLGSEPS
jgi:hypothetical protein